MFINKDCLLSILQVTEYQWEVYKSFLKLANDEQVASKQTEIHMAAMMRGSKQDN